MKYKSVILSDIHLGSSHCQADKLLSFLKSLETKDGHGYQIENLFLNGDIIDMTNMNHKIFWTQHRKIIKKFLRMADKNVKVFYLVGNHDFYIHEIFKHDFDLDFNGIEFSERHIHIAADEKKYLILHGDQFDGMVKINPWLYKLGDFAYSIMHVINTFQNKIRRLFKIKEWSFAHWVKSKAKSAVQFVSNFEQLVVDEAKKEKVDGVCAGHIHIPQDIMIGDIRYLNSGTWCELTSCIVEHIDGRMEVLILE
jgi:UDP-2,3-diacylglucosamine pyrophosphatase LpxH